jgi:hypothetical protein
MRRWPVWRIVPLVSVLLAVQAARGRAADLDGVRVAAVDSGAGQLSIYSIRFVIPPGDSLPADGIIRVVFPQGFDLSFVLAAMGTDDLNGGLTVAVSGDTIDLKRDRTGTALASGSTVGVRIANVRNATAVGSYSIIVRILTADSTFVGSGSDDLSVVPGPLHHFTLSGFPSTATAGQALAGTITVRACDAYGNLKTDYAGTVRWSSSDSHPQVSLPDPSSFDGGTGIKTFSGSEFKLCTAGAQTFTVSDLSASISATSSPILVTAAQISSFSLLAPSSATAGQTFPLAVTGAMDAYGNPASGTVQVTLTTPGTSPNGTQPQLADIAVSNGSGSAPQLLVRAGSATLRGQVGSSGPAQMVSLEVRPGALASFGLAGTPSSAVAGQAFSGSVVVTAYDAFGNTKTDYVGSVYFQSTDTRAQLPYTSSSRYTFTQQDAGVHSFLGNGFVLKTSGVHTITVTDGAISQTSGPISVAPGAIASFSLSAGSIQTAGVAFPLQVTNAMDAYGNPASGTVQVTLTTPGTSPNGTQPQLADIAVSNGSGSAPQLLVRAGSATLRGQVGSSGPAQMVSLEVRPGALASFGLAGTPSSAVAGQAFSGSVVVTAYDAFGNTKTDYVGSVYFQSTDTRAQLPYTSSSRYTFTQQDAGVHSFLGNGFVLKTSGVHTITVTDGAISQTSGPISVAPGAIASFSLSAGSIQTAGVAFPLQVTNAVDAYGNAWSGLVTISAASGGGNSPNGTAPTLQNISVVNGTGSADQLLVNAVPTVLQGQAGTVQVLSGTIQVGPGAFGSLVMSGVPSAAVAGVAFPSSITITVLDRFGNRKTDYTGSVYFFCDTDPTATLPHTSSNPYSFVSSDAGQHSFSGFVLRTPGTHRLGVREVATGYELLSAPISVTGLELVSVSTGVNRVSQGQSGIEVSLTVRKWGSQAVTELQAALRFIQAEQDVSSDYVVTRVDTHSVIRASDEGSYMLRFRVTVKPAAHVGAVVLSGSVSGKVGGNAVGDETPGTTATWTVYKPASVSISLVNVDKDTVSQGASGVRATLTVTNGDPNTSPAVLDEVDLLFYGAGGDQTSDFVRTPDGTNPTQITGGSSANLGLSIAVSQVARTGPVRVYGKVRYHDLYSGQSGTVTSAGYDNVYIRESPALRILSIAVTQPRVSRGQTRPWEVRVKVQNATGSAQTIDFGPTATYIRFRKAGQDLTSEYKIIAPTSLGGGEAILNPGVIDSLIYTVTKTGTTSGEITIFSRVATVGGAIYTDSELSGKFGAVTVQTEPSLTIQRLVPSQTSVTAGQNTPWTVRAVVTNQGQADFQLNLDSTRIQFSTGSDFQVQKPAGWSRSQSLVLAGGSTDTLVFTVKQTGQLPGACTISGLLKGVDINSLAFVEKSTDLTNQAQVQVQSPAVLRITKVIASDTFLTRGTSTNWTVRLRVENGGESNVTVDLDSTAVLFIRSGTVQTDYTVQRPSSFVNSGSTLLRGGSQDELVYVVTKTGTGLGSVTVKGSLRAIENNSGRIIRIAQSDSLDRIVVQTPANVIAISRSLIPTQVNRGSNARFSVRVHNGGGSTVTLNPLQTLIRFTDGARTFQATLDSQLVRTIPPGDTTLTFLSQPVPANMTVGTYRPEVVLAGTENRNPYSKTLQLTDTVRVNEAAALAIESIRTSQPSVTAGQTRAWRIVMLLTNNGGSALRLDSTRLHFYRLSQNVDAHLSYSRPSSFAGSGTPQLGGGKTDSLIFTVNQVSASIPTGNIRIQGAVYVTDVNDTNRHLAQSTDGNSGYVVVQSPAVLEITRVRPRQTSVTMGQTEDWAVSVWLQNKGESAVQVDSSALNTYLLFGLGTGWQLKPARRLSNGTWILSGGKTDSLVFVVDQTEASAKGSCTVDARIRAVEVNSGREIIATSGPTARGSVVVESPAQLRIDTVLVSLTTAPNAPRLDTDQPYLLRVRVVNLGEDEADSVVVGIRSKEGFSSLPGTLYVGTVAGNSGVWAEAQAKTGTVPDTSETVTVAVRKAIARNTRSPAFISPALQPGDTTYVLRVERPAQLAIDSVWTDRDTVLAKQTSPYWHVYVAVRDAGRGPVRLANPSASDLQFRIGTQLQAGYVVVPPSLTEGERTLDPAAGDTSLVLTYEIRQTGATGGLVWIEASVAGTDLNYPGRQPSPAAKGVGRVYVASLAAVQITRTEPVARRLDGQGRALVNTSQGFAIQVDVANKGGEDLLNVSVSLQPEGGSTVEGAKTIDTLRVGETRRLEFAVTASAQENLTGERFLAHLSSPGRGRESGLSAEMLPPSDDVAVAVIQTPASLRLRWVRNASPNTPYVNSGQTFPVDAMIENLGTEGVDSVRVSLTGDPDSLLAQPVYTVALPRALAGHDSTTVRFSVSAGSGTGVVSLRGEVVKAIGENSGAAAEVVAALSDTSHAILQRPAALAEHAVWAEPDTVIAESRQEWRIYAIVADTGEASLTLTPSSSDVRFIVGGQDETANYTVVPPTRLEHRTDLTLAGGEIDTLVYRVTETGPRGGPGTIRVQVRGYDRNLGAQTGQLAAVATGSFFVQTNAVVRIRRTEVLAPHLSLQGWGIVNTGQPFRIRVTVEERQGREGVDSVRVRLISQNGSSSIPDPVLTIPYIGPSGSGAVEFDVVASASENLVGELFQAEIVAATAHESRIPAFIEPPADPMNARAMVRVEKPARLALSMATADNILTAGEVFPIEILVRNLGTSLADTGGRVEIFPPEGYEIEVGEGEFTAESVVLPFQVDEVVRIRMRAPDVASVADTILAAIVSVPLDLNSFEPCLVQVDLARVVVSTLLPFMRISRAEIVSPPGARDGILSTGQDFFLRTDVVCSPDLNSRRIALRVPSGRGYVVVGDTSRVFTADSATVYWYLKAPGSADLDWQSITVFAEGIDGTGTRQEAVDTIWVQAVPRAILSLQVSIVAPPGATDGVLTQGQPFLLQAKIVNGGQAAAVGRGRLRLDLGNTGIDLDEAEADSLVRTFEMAPNVQTQTVTWRLRAPDRPRDPDILTVYFESRPNDENTDGPANLAHWSQDLTVSTVPGGYVRLDSLFIASPEGARDGVVSSGQTFVVTAVLTAEGVAGDVEAYIWFSSREYFTASTLSKVLAGRGVSASWQVVAPDRTSPSPDTVWVSLVARDANNDTLTLRDVSEPLVVQTVERARLILRPSIEAPAGAADGVLSTGQRFVVKARIENRGTAGLVGSDSFRVRISMPVAAGYKLAPGETEVKASRNPELSWELEAPTKPTLATHNIEFQLEDRPRDENSYQKAEVLRDRDVVSVTTVQRARLQLAAAITQPPAAQSGSVWTGQTFTVTAWLENLGDAGWIVDDSLKMKLSAPPGFIFLEDSVAGSRDGRVVWHLQAPKERGKQYTLLASLLDVPWDENSGEAAEVVRGQIPLTVSVQAKMVIFTAQSVQKSNTVASGQTGVALLRFRLENRGESGGDPVLVRKLRVRFTDRHGKEIAPSAVASQVWVSLAGAPGQAIARSETLGNGNPVSVVFRDGRGDTLVGGVVRDYVLNIDLLPESQVEDFQVQIASVADLDVVDAESGTPVVIGDRNGNPIPTLNLVSDFSVVVTPDLKKSFGCYPNPFGYGTRKYVTIVYYLRQTTSVDIRIYSLAGELVWSRHFDASDPRAREGMHDGDVTWDGRNGEGMAVLNGVYVVQIVTGTGESAMTKVAVVR